MPNRSTSLATSPKFATVTPSDTADLDPRPRAIYVGTGGRIDFMGEDDVVVPFHNAASGMEYSVSPKRIMSTNLAASNLVAYY